MRKFIFVSSALLLAGGIWSCDKIWSSSVVDCGGPGFKCPDGYTPPGPDMSMTAGDGGGTTGDGSTGGMDMASILPSYTSVYAVPGAERLTLVGTANGTVNIYKDSGNGTPGRLSDIAPKTASPVVGVWQGKVRDMGIGQEKKLRITAFNNKTISYQIDNDATVERTTTQNINSIWVGAWNQETTYGYSAFHMFTAGDAGELTDWMIGTDAAVSKASATTLGSGANKLTSVTGSSDLSDYSLGSRCMMALDDCTDGVAWLAGEGGSLYSATATQMPMSSVFAFTWQPVAAFTNKAGAAYQAIGAGSSVPSMSTLISVAVAGTSGVYAEQEAGGWVGSAAGGATFGNNTIRSISYCSSGEAWATGSNGAVYRGLHNSTSGKMVWGQQSLIGGRDYSSTTFYSIHCAPANGTRPQRVSVVGSNGTFLFMDYSGGAPGIWGAAVEQ